MALGLLDGTNSNIDVSIVPPGGGTAYSYKCQINSIAIEAVRQLFTRITFCSTNWIQNLNGMKGLQFALTGYPGKGTAGSKPFQYFLTDAYGLITATIDTGCTVSFTAAISRETLGMIAASNGSWTLEGANKNDDLMVSWVVV